MGLLSLTEMIQIVRKYFLQILAASLAAGFLGGFIAEGMQTYTCTLRFKYNHSGAEERLAPDGVSKLDPYEIQNPEVVQKALNKMGFTDNSDTKGIRQNIAVNKVVTALDKEVADSAALLGEKYDVNATEYEMKFTYKAALGDEFGAKVFDSIIHEYDEFLLAKYYNKKNINDFGSILKNTKAEYIVIADSISSDIEKIIEYLQELSDSNPKFRSTVTGYTFEELGMLYQNLLDVQYSKYYGNVRAGNLAKDKELVIKSYRTKAKELHESWSVDYPIAENYREEIGAFYNSYKKTGLYIQARQTQTTLDTTNNRDQDVLDDRKLRDYTNTYDDIVLSYTKHASNATDSHHNMTYYNTIIDAYENDNVEADVKAGLLEKNEKILDEICSLSSRYSRLAMTTVDELYKSKVSSDLQYLIVPEVTVDKPIKLIAVFLMIFAFGMFMILAFIYEIMKKFVDVDKIFKNEERKIKINTEEMDELHSLLYSQYLDDFSEFYLVYQPMLGGEEDRHIEAFIRWRSPQLGMISPGKIVEAVGDLGIFKQLNDWIIKNVCKDIDIMREQDGDMPVVHVNCPYSQVNDFGLEDIIFKHIKNYNIPADNLCLELAGKDIADSLEDIMLLEKIGVKICIDNFENSNEEQEIIDVIRPQYIKMSVDILNSDIYATSDDEIEEAMANMQKYFADIIGKCHKNNIKACICGIETKEQNEFVSCAGFDFKQGYFYAKPQRLDVD